MRYEADITLSVCRWDTIQNKQLSEKIYIYEQLETDDKKVFYTQLLLICGNVDLHDCVANVFTAQSFQIGNMQVPYDYLGEVLLFEYVITSKELERQVNNDTLRNYIPLKRLAREVHEC